MTTKTTLRIAINGLDERHERYIRALASKGGMGWGTAPRVFERLRELGLVFKGRDTETGAETAYITPTGKDVARSITYR